MNTNTVRHILEEYILNQDVDILMTDLIHFGNLSEIADDNLEELVCDFITEVHTNDNKAIDIAIVNFINQYEQYTHIQED